MRVVTRSLIATFCSLVIVAYAQSPREQLQQMVQQLQKTPTDNALREKIIKLGAEIKPAPTIPDEAIKHEGRAQATFANARSKAGFASAVKEYEQAVATAPWVVGYYYDLCTIYEKAGVFLEAQRNCQRALVGEQGTSERVALMRRIAGLDLLAEKTSDRNLRPNPSYSPPFQMEIDLAKWPIGTRYFCGAWSRKDDIYARRENWLVYSGTALTGVDIGWISSEKLAEVFRHGYNLDQFDFGTKEYWRDPGRDLRYDERNHPGIQMGWVLEISIDKATINRSNAHGVRESCMRQGR